jgi:thiol-disulfide isomerase/thioredoxin
MRTILFCLLIGFATILTSCESNGDNLINGKTAPGLSLPDTLNQKIDLRSFHGKLVLVDFWASWCKPCRKENPYLVKVYDEFHNRRFEGASGFEILSVSLDSRRDSWIKAIHSDSLHWPNHVSELNGWKSSAVATYGVSSIPTSFLLDQDGMIIGKDLRSDDLEKLLNARVKQ